LDLDGMPDCGVRETHTIKLFTREVELTKCEQ